MTELERLHNAAGVPVVVLEKAEDAVPTAKALLAGGVDVMEITFRTAAAADSIAAVTKECPNMLVGTGTVITLEQCRKAAECGAKFIVSSQLQRGDCELVRRERHRRHSWLRYTTNQDHGGDGARLEGREVLPCECLRWP